MITTVPTNKKTTFKKSQTQKGTPVASMILGKFRFTANIPGLYTLYISNDDLLTHYVDYDYTISSPILGFDPIVLIGLVIAISIVLTLVNIYLNWYRTNGDRGNPPQPIK